MKTVIPAWRILTNWIIAVLTGSLLSALYNSLYKGGGQLEDLIGSTIIAVVFSAIFSFPAVGILLIAHVVLNDRNVSLKDHRRIHMLIHLLVSVLTFAVIAWANFDGREIFSSLGPWLVAISYIASGLTTAFVTYRIYEKRAGKKPEPDSVSDNSH